MRSTSKLSKHSLRILVSIFIVSALVLFVKSQNIQASEEVDRPITQGGGVVNQNYLYGEEFGGSMHRGVDFSHASAGSNVYATAPGTVVAIRENMDEDDFDISDPNDQRYFGNYVMIRHNNQHYDLSSGQMAYAYSIYAHLQESSVPVVVNDVVGYGTHIGNVGNTGNSLGAHLHLQINLSHNMNENDPEDWAWSENTSRNPELWIKEFNHGNTQTASAVGVLSNANGEPIEDRFIWGMEKPSAAEGNITYNYVTNRTYAYPWTNPDDILYENFGTTDIEPGEHTVQAKTANGTLIEDFGQHTFIAGQTTYIGLYPVYLPDIRNAPGNWKSRISIRNNSSSDNVRVVTTYFHPNGPVHSQRTDTLGDHASRSFNSPSNFYGSATAVGTEDIAVLVEHQRDSNKERTNYTGILPMTSEHLTTPGWELAGTTLYAPVVKYNYYGVSSLIVVRNTGRSATTATATYYYDNGSSPNPSIAQKTIEPNGVGYFINNTCTNGLCSAVIEADEPLTAVAMESKTSNGKRASTYNLFGEGSSTLHFPIVKDEWYNVSTGLRIQNVSSTSTTVTIKFYNESGTLKCTITKNINGQGSTTIWNESCLQSSGGWIGSAVVTASSNRKLVGQSNEISLNWQILSGMSGYLGGVRKASAPLIYNKANGGNPYNDVNDWLAGVTVKNLSNSNSATVDVSFYNTNGIVVDTSTNTIPKRGVGVFFASDLLRPFTGSVVVESNRDTITSVNIVNFSPTGDPYAIHNASAR